MKSAVPCLIVGLVLGSGPAAFAKETAASETNAPPLPEHVFAGLKVRSLGPALMSGRIGDFAVNPQNPAEYYVAVCSGGVWKTSNGGVTWRPVFDRQGSYSVGCVTLDPRNPHTVWVGTGENNSQRSVGWGDGVYRSRDGGAHWENVGLTNSQHIGMIVVHPRRSDTVYVAAQGPLWNAGGDRGLYRTTDGGRTWERILYVDEDTGANEVHLDPRDPNTIYVSTYQRRRRVWTLIDGGPGSALYKSTDGGKTWRKIVRGLPKVDLGRIGLAISPVNPDVLYAIVEAADGKGGFFRSTNRGETWEKRSGHVSGSPQYFQEIFADPLVEGRVYALDVFTQVTEDGGKTWRKLGNKDRHVDDHALWIDPRDNRHLLIGGDGGIYETYDRGATWRFTANLPVTQFYRVSTDHARPFYNVYGGTQDNNSQGGPSRTLSRAGIANEDWFVTVGGDGYETVVDPDDPNTIYAMWQYGGLVRYDRRSGEITDIKPREAPGEPPLKWNWDSPLILSPHNPHRLYFAANRLFRSDDRGNSWRAISGDLTRGIDRNTLEVMGRIHGVDAVARHMSTSIYGNATALCESPRREGLLWVGTDDGLVHVTADGGRHWRKIATFYGVPERTYVSCLTASRFEADTVFAAFDNHKNGDFKPYLLRSDDRGATWRSIAGDLPAREVVYAVQQDHERPDLLFAGTEFGAWFTLDGGVHWHRVAGLPTIAVRDLDLQRRENDLVLATFGRGFYILDDYTPLRHITPALTNETARLFPVKDALRYVPNSRLGGRSGRGWQGGTYFTAKNPPFGAVFTYYLKEKITSLKERRQEAEKKAAKAGRPVRQPALDELRAEDRQLAPQVQLIVRDAQGCVVRRIPASRDRGSHRVAWDLRYPAPQPAKLSANEDLPPWEDLPSGPLALPGQYTVTLVKIVDGEETPLAGPVDFKVVPLDLATFAAKDKDAVLAFQKQVANLQRAVEGAIRAADEALDRLRYLQVAIRDTPGGRPQLWQRSERVRRQLLALKAELSGDPVYGRVQEAAPPSIRGRVNSVAGSQWHVTAPPTKTQREQYRYAAEAFEKLLPRLRRLIGHDLKALETDLERLGAPWTPGRLPEWRPGDSWGRCVTNTPAAR